MLEFSQVPAGGLPVATWSWGSHRAFGPHM